MDLSVLQATFNLPGHAEINLGRGGLPTIFVANASSRSEITLLGAHVLSFIPRDQADLLWLSPASPFQSGVAIRGGIPLCWPWFGAHGDNASLPMHGFARVSDWRLEEITALSAGQTSIVLSLKDNETTRQMWPHQFDLRLQIDIGQDLQLTLITRNTGATPLPLAQAVHTYFNISHVDQVSISGYDGAKYYDKVAGGEKCHTGDILLEREIDAVFQGCPGQSVIKDAGLKRQIIIDKQGSDSAVVWNPWVEKSKTLSGFHPQAYQNMVCVETANVGADAKVIQPQQTHSLRTIIAAAKA